MRLYMNTTSPFARLVRLAIAEKALDDRVGQIVVDPWTEPPDLLRVNPAGAIPVLETGDGHAISGSQLILRYLDGITAPSVFPSGNLAATLEIAAIALGVTEAAVSIMIGRKSDDGFDAGTIGQKRYRTMAGGLARLDANPPRDFADRPDIANLATVTALDYVIFRFADRDWLEKLPALRAWRERQRGRPSIEATLPGIQPSPATGSGNT